MKWFKHLSGSLDDPDIEEAIELFGGDGYLVFFGTLEIMADEFDVNDPQKVTIPLKHLTKRLQLSTGKALKILKYYGQKTRKKARILFTLEGKYITLSCPRFKDLCDEWTSKQLRSPIIEEEEKKKSNNIYYNPSARTRESDNDSLPDPLFSNCYALVEILIHAAKRYDHSFHLSVLKKRNWANIFCQLARTRTYETVKTILKFAIEDKFWKTKILDAEAFSRNFTKISAQHKASQEQIEDNPEKRKREREDKHTAEVNQIINDMLAIEKEDYWHVMGWMSISCYTVIISMLRTTA